MTEHVYSALAFPCRKSLRGLSPCAPQYATYTGVYGMRVCPRRINYSNAANPYTYPLSGPGNSYGIRIAAERTGVRPLSHLGIIPMCDWFLGGLTISLY